MPDEWGHDHEHLDANHIREEYDDKAKEIHDTPSEPKDSSQCKREIEAKRRRGRREPRSRALACWRRSHMRQNHAHESGDLVEAEWEKTGWWFVGYVAGLAQSKGKNVFHVVFEDGEEADIHGRHLRRLNPPDGTIRHLPVADLGSGQLYRLGMDEPPPPSQGDGSTAGTDVYQEDEEPSLTSFSGERSRAAGNAIASTSREAHDESPSVIMKGTFGNLRERRWWGSRALWGPTQTARSKLRDDSKPCTEAVVGEGTKNTPTSWWSTGTPYAFQPRLRGPLPPISAQSHGGVGGGNWRTTLQDESRDREPLPMSDDQALFHIVKPAETNPDKGNKLFYVMRRS